MREIICIVCPNGCELQAGDDLSVSGNLCERGRQFALQEIRDPRRTVTTVCKTVFPDHPFVPVKSAGGIPRDLVKQAVREAGRKIIDRPLGIGETVIENILGTGVDIIICTNELKEVR